MLTWDVDPILFEGPPPVRTYGLLLAFALVGGFLIFRWQVMRAGHPEATAGWFLASGLVGVVVGARLAHCFLYDLPRTLADPLVVVRPWEGGLSSHGAVLGLVVALALFARRRRLRFADLADRLSFGNLLAVVLVRVANFMNSEIVGRPTGGAWGVRFVRWDGPAAPPRHPVQLYEAALGLVLLAVVFAIDRRWGERRPTGLLTSLALVLYFGLRLGLEVWKEPEGLPASSPWTLGQLLSVAPAVIGAVWLIRVLRARPQTIAAARKPA
jgi:prolipoprotein diacylglyceryl transferase